MPLGAFRLNSIARLQAVAVPEVPTRTAKSVTAIGDAQIDTALQKFGSASGLFDGTGDRLETATTYTDFNFTSQDFTVECWFYVDSATSPGDRCLFSTIEEYTDNGWSLNTWSSNSFLFVSGTGGGSFSTLQSSTSVWSEDTWNHVAVCRSGSTLEIFCNGNRVYTTGSFTDIQGWAASTAKFFVGWGRGIDGSTFSASNEFYWYGSLDELRVSDNVRYSGATYTQPTSAFTNDANTLLLLHMDGTDGSTVFLDDGGLTDLTAPTATFAQFGTLADDAWGGMVDEAVTSQVSDSNTITLSMWIYPTLVTGANRPESVEWSLLQFTDTGSKAVWFLRLLDNGGMRWYKHWGASFEDFGTWLPTGTFTANSWQHLAIAISGSTMKVYVDGSSVTPNNTVTSTNWDWDQVDNIALGCDYQGNFGALGDRMAQIYMSHTYQDLDTLLSRFYDSGYVYMGPDGVASGANTPTIFLDGDSAQITSNRGNTSGDWWQNWTPHNESSNTTGPAGQYPWNVFGLGDIVEWDNTIQGTTSRTRKTITANNVTANISEEKFGYSAFDHVGSTLADSWLDISPSSDFAWGTGDYTFELWVNPDNDGRTRWLWDTRSSSTNGSAVYIDSSNNLNLVTGGTTTTGTATVATGTYRHIAVCRSSGTTKLYVDGVEDISVSDTTDHTNSAGDVKIGSDYAETTQQTFGGYIDEVRISTSARYTSNFTVMSRRQNNDSNCIFLTHCDVRNGSTSFLDDNITG